MVRRVVVFIAIAVVVLAFVPARFARVDSDRVLLIYNDKDEMSVLSNLITACGKQTDALDIMEYEPAKMEGYDYIVLQDNTPLTDALEMGKRVACVGTAFMTVPGVEIKRTAAAVNAELGVYTNAETVTLDQGTPYIAGCSGETIGSLSIDGASYPLCAVTDSVLYAPYLCADDLSAFAVGQMFNRYFGQQDGGKMYVMIDEVYPFDDLDMLRLTAKKFYENGIPFIVCVMPVYYNTEYPAFKRYANVLRYMQSVGGSMVLHAALETGNELVGDPLDVRMEQALQTFTDSGVVIYDEEITPYVISLDALSGMLPQNERFITLPIDTLIQFGVFEDEEELDAAIDAINAKWLQIGDFRRDSGGGEYPDDQESVDSDYQYREVAERRYAFLVDTGNQVLFVIVIVSAVSVLVLTSIGYRLYRRKFLKKKREEEPARRAKRHETAEGTGNEGSGSGKAEK